MANKGRPRSEKAKKAILDAAYALLLENGFHAITIEEIAKQAGVSKATIYKWWPNKAAVAADSFFAASTENFPLPDTGSCEKDLFNQANQLSRFLATDKGRIITELIAEGQFDADVANAYRSRYFKPRRSISRKILEQAIVRGELPDDLDLEFVYRFDLRSAVLSPAYYGGRDRLRLFEGLDLIRLQWNQASRQGRRAAWRPRHIQRPDRPQKCGVGYGPVWLRRPFLAGSAHLGTLRRGRARRNILGYRAQRVGADGKKICILVRLFEGLSVRRRVRRRAACRRCLGIHYFFRERRACLHQVRVSAERRTSNNELFVEDVEVPERAL